MLQKSYTAVLKNSKTSIGVRWLGFKFWCKVPQFWGLPQEFEFININLQTFQFFCTELSDVFFKSPKIFIFCWNVIAFRKSTNIVLRYKTAQQKTGILERKYVDHPVLQEVLSGEIVGCMVDKSVKWIHPLS